MAVPVPVPLCVTPQAMADAVCRCGRPFACGAATGRCWCMDRPAVLPVPAAAGSRCLCPACLDAAGRAAASAADPSTATRSAG